MLAREPVDRKAASGHTAPTGAGKNARGRTAWNFAVVAALGLLFTGGCALTDRQFRQADCHQPIGIRDRSGVLKARHQQTWSYRTANFGYSPPYWQRFPQEHLVPHTPWEEVDTPESVEPDLLKESTTDPSQEPSPPPEVPSETEASSLSTPEISEKQEEISEKQEVVSTKQEEISEKQALRAPSAAASVSDNEPVTNAWAPFVVEPAGDELPLRYDGGVVRRASASSPQNSVGPPAAVKFTRDRETPAPAKFAWLPQQRTRFR